jgi:acylphosphatase
MAGVSDGMGPCLQGFLRRPDPTERSLTFPPPKLRPQSRAMPNDEHPIRRRAIVHGNVQGVFFRDSTRQRAEAHGVAGWVSNRSDGAVEAVLEGPSEAVDRVLRFLETGPPQASVDHVDVSEEEPEGLTGFSIR